MRFRALLCLTAIAAAAGMTTVARSGESGAATYHPAVLEDGMTFPVARSNWYSVINFTNDWHDPRMRLVDGEWLQVGIHEGTDIFAEPGTPIRAILGGTVEQMGWTFYSGWRVGVRGTDGRYWFYAHMSRFAQGLEIGSPVAAGQTLGKVGNTGYGTRPGHHDEFTYHLHLGIQEPDGTWVNPYPILHGLYRAATQGAR
jgi:murein DD-endopeptidase MepM/ murein hydrolase activator NlpD